MKINRNHVKTVAVFVAKSSVNTVIKTVISQNTVPNTRLHAAGMYVGAFTLGMTLAKPIETAVHNEIDELAETLDKIRSRTTPDATV